MEQKINVEQIKEAIINAHKNGVCLRDQLVQDFIEVPYDRKFSDTENVLIDEVVMYVLDRLDLRSDDASPVEVIGEPQQKGGAWDND